MEITYDPEKRAKTLAERGLDFEDAVQVFDGPTVDFIDDRQNYGEDRFISLGHLRGRLIVVVWTQRGDTRHIISMRKANEREQEKHGRQLGS
jgi:Uncharacterized protein conserved in bacteria